MGSDHGHGVRYQVFHARNEGPFHAAHVRHNGVQSEMGDTDFENGFKRRDRCSEDEQVCSRRRVLEICGEAVNGMELDSLLEILDPAPCPDDMGNEPLLLTDHSQGAADQAHPDNRHLFEERKRRSWRVCFRLQNPPVRASP